MKYLFLIFFLTAINANAADVCSAGKVRMNVWITSDNKPHLQMSVSGVAQDMTLDTGAYDAWPGTQFVRYGHEPVVYRYCSGNFCANQYSWFASWPANGLIGPHWLSGSDYTSICVDPSLTGMLRAGTQKCPNWPYHVNLRHDTPMSYYWMSVKINGRKTWAVLDTGSGSPNVSKRYLPGGSLARICAGNFCSQNTTTALPASWDSTNALLGWSWMRAGGVNQFCLDTKRKVLWMK